MWGLEEVFGEGDLLAGSVAGGYEGLLCACGAGVQGFVHGSVVFHGWERDFGGVVHEIRLFHGWRGVFGVFVHEKP